MISMFSCKSGRLLQAYVETLFWRSLIQGTSYPMRVSSVRPSEQQNNALKYTTAVISFILNKFTTYSLIIRWLTLWSASLWRYVGILLCVKKIISTQTEHFFEYGAPFEICIHRQCLTGDVGETANLVWYPWWQQDHRAKFHQNIPTGSKFIREGRHTDTKISHVKKFVRVN